MFIVPFIMFVLMFVVLILLVTQIILPAMSEEKNYFWILKRSTWFKNPKLVVPSLKPKEQLEVATSEYNHAKKTLETVIKNVKEDKEEAKEAITAAEHVEKSAKDLQKKHKP